MHTSNWKAYAYDNRGNVINNGITNFIYDKTNQPSVMSGAPEGNGNFIYDGNLKRVKQVVDDEIIYSIYNLNGHLMSQYNKTTKTHTDHIRANNMLIARIESLGSLADPSTTPFSPMPKDDFESGDIRWMKDYMPYGAAYSTTEYGSADAKVSA